MTEPRRILDAKENQIRDNLRLVAELAHDALADAMASLAHTDMTQARDVVARDQRINELRRLIEQDCLVAMATQQPEASDLREIVAGMHTAVELERIGDYGADIARIVLELDEQTVPGAVQQGLQALGEHTRDMLKDVMTAYVQRDEAAARNVAAQDNAADEAEQHLIQQLLDFMQKDCDQIGLGTRLLWITHNLERVGDRVTNIAERVVFMRSGQSPELNA